MGPVDRHGRRRAEPAQRAQDGPLAVITLTAPPLNLFDRELVAAR